MAALDTHKWVTLGSVSARARKRSISGALAEAGGHAGHVSSLHLQHNHGGACSCLGGGGKAAMLGAWTCQGSDTMCWQSQVIT